MSHGYDVAELLAHIRELEKLVRSMRPWLRHGPRGAGGPGPCDLDCLKCEADAVVATLDQPNARAPPESSPFVLCSIRLCAARCHPAALLTANWTEWNGRWVCPGHGRNDQ